MIEIAIIVGEGINPEDYHKQSAKRGDKDYVVGRSDLAEFARNPHRWRAGYKEESTSSTDWGSLMDCLILTPEEFEKRYVVAPQSYPCEPTKKDPRNEKPWNWNATYCIQWKAEFEAVGKTVLKSETYDRAKDSVEVLLADERAGELLDCSQAQIWVVGKYRDRLTGLTITVKALLDLVPDKSHSIFGRCLADYKTSGAAYPKGWPRQIYNHDYHWQAALSLDLYTAATGEDRTDWLHLIQENFHPWSVGRRLLSTEFIDLGRWQYRAALARYALCLESNVWPGYDDGPDGIIDGWSLTEPEPWMVSVGQICL